MADHLITVALMALVSRGAFVAMGEGMVLERLGKLIARLPMPLRKPLGACSYCMVSVWGTAAVFMFSGLVVPPLYLLPFYWLAAAGLQALIDR